MQIRWATAFLDLPAERFEPGVAFWRSITGYSLSAFRGQLGEFATLLPPDGDAYLRVQRVAGPGGCHLDLHLAADPSATAGRAVGLGARLVQAADDLVILSSPGGFTFCLVGWAGEQAVPGPVGGARADQLCLDVPAELFAAEAAFWSAFTGWPLRPVQPAEFTRLEPPPGLPLRFLLQRRAVSAPGDPVRGHLDLAAGSGRSSLAERHVAAGARLDAEFEHWIALTDPAGLSYCLTARDPATGH